MKKSANKKLDRSRKSRDLKKNLLMVNNASELINGKPGNNREGERVTCD